MSFNAGIRYAAHLLKFRGAETIDWLDGSNALDDAFVAIMCKELAKKLDEYSEEQSAQLSYGIHILEFDN